MALLLVPLCAGFGYGLWDWERVGPPSAAHTLIIPHGDSQRVQQALVAAGVIRSDLLDRTVFGIGVWLTRSDGVLHAAELVIPAHASMREIVWILRHAPAVQHRLTIPEGWTARQIAAYLAENDLLMGPVPEIAEGSVLPETLSFVRGTSRVAIVARLHHMEETALARVWQSRDLTVALPNAYALLVLASIVERETSIAEERPQIARVFLNRLSRGMRLQSDPTVIYDLSEGWGVLDHPLRHDELSEAGPENTYRTAGLPPAPICSPGRAALDAVAHPAPGDALYFVATGFGGHRFAATLDEHNHNVASFRTHAQALEGPKP